MSLGRDYADEIAIAQLEAIERSERIEMEARQNLEKGMWVTKEGEALQIQKMTSSHIQNCIKFIERSSDDTGVGKEYVKAFKAELKRREKEMER